jgi:aquaporin Z
VICSSKILTVVLAVVRLKIYVIDGVLLGLFMLSACVSVVVLEHPASAVRAAIASPFARRACVGLAMGLTAAALIYSPWGKQSGAFMNPAVVLCHLRLGKLSAADALGYISAQFFGSAGGVLLGASILPGLVSDPSVNYVVTTPNAGITAAFVAEFTLAFVMASVVMTLNRSARLAPYTGVGAAVLVAVFITMEAPISGMSINPARSFGSALWAQLWSGFWIYLTAPVLGMLAGVELQRLSLARHARPCGKLTHDETIRCFVRCHCLEGSQATHD